MQTKEDLERGSIAHYEGIEATFYDAGASGNYPEFGRRLKKLPFTETFAGDPEEVYCRTPVEYAYVRDPDQQKILKRFPALLRAYMKHILTTKTQYGVLRFGGSTPVYGLYRENDLIEGRLIIEELEEFILKKSSVENPADLWKKIQGVLPVKAGNSGNVLIPAFLTD